jgi:NAD+ kinase
MIIALFANTSKKQSRNLALSVAEFLANQNITVVTEDEEAETIGVKPISEVNPADIQFLISMGGDGTILKLFHKYHYLEAPILGINLGHLGFMADVPI